VDDGQPMPPDPFREGQPDMGAWAGQLYGFYSALLSSGFPEQRAFELTDTFLQTSMVNAAAQQPGGV
jgi:hypothetical protein